MISLQKKPQPTNPEKNPNNKKNVLGKIYRTLAHEAALHLGEACSNLNMKYLQKQACLETKRNESNWHPGFRIWVQAFFSP